MIAKGLRPPVGLPLSRPVFALTLLASTALASSLAHADGDDVHFRPGHLLLSRAVFVNNAVTITPGVTQLPPNCVSPNCVTATADGTYPTVFNNDGVDGSFGLTAKILLDELRLDGRHVQSLEVPNSAQRGISQNKDQMVTSFSSKSELALNLSLDHRSVTFMGYLAPIGAIDVSNSNTPDVIDPTNPVPGTYYRLVAEVDENGRFHFTKVNGYSGNNGRAAVFNDRHGAGVFYTAGNAGNGGNPQPAGVITGAGMQIAREADAPLARQADPGGPFPLGSFNITELGQKADKIGKDTNFRGLTVFNNVIYTTKGSGGNGINTVYFIDTTGNAANGSPKACPNGVGLPVPSASLPTTQIFYDGSKLAGQGVTPYNMCVLSGFPTALKSTTAFPFGIWFADANTLYVADEGNGTATFDPASNSYTAAKAQTSAGLQKWVFDSTAGAWKQAYTLQAGLDLGVPYTVQGYPTGNNAATGKPWSPATDGLRNITGRVNRDGSVSIWAITSTVSGSGDQGADPNKLVMITDKLSAATLPAGERFVTLRTANSGEALRGVSFTPGTGDGREEAHDRGSCGRDHRGDDCRDID
ncbi:MULTISPECIES: hypothetical protein [unclassified Bradyrhizobium]|uniref:hypothetical protein n=1 Tax=unclassified Bradyrhizobium TaxID=2631580 RepID=UPI001BAD84E1|nr:MULTISPECIES: hypothetical protein [unclassified Bradyrhizobium]MBR1206521.1 hypothetical protein [Bradyrhizobium sp. AUGA SZCCT0124]MBR1315501.1 hypothetical protein [Bradyrhizobium sp. AUGA SZCCT0051]MBR1338437.1 hypothetical protein [Bradyrhizobium sp. AUGA SZCCT0105]MBR1356092.1 hypothetical protein [Bradyrhizobium sp. AUGA SZCCT0045]